MKAGDNILTFCMAPLHECFMDSSAEESQIHNNPTYANAGTRKPTDCSKISQGERYIESKTEVPLKAECVGK